MFRFDTHMHFDLYKNRKSILDYVENSKSYTIAVTNLPELYEKYKGMDSCYKYVNIALGFHPELVSDYEKQISIFERNVNNSRYIGEVGMDYTTTDKAEREKQFNIFTSIIAMSMKNDKIVTVHSRGAEKDVLDITKDFPGTIILHWFSGNIGLIGRAVDEGKYFSINHQMTRSNRGRKIIEKIPLNRMLIESDAPFTKGLEKNYSTDFMNVIYDTVAEIKDIAVDDLYIVFKENFKRIII